MDCHVRLRDRNIGERERERKKERKKERGKSGRTLADSLFPLS
jgi:hypothetical protein